MDNRSEEIRSPRNVDGPRIRRIRNNIILIFTIDLNLMSYCRRPRPYLILDVYSSTTAGRRQNHEHINIIFFNGSCDDDIRRRWRYDLKARRSLSIGAVQTKNGAGYLYFWTNRYTSVVDVLDLTVQKGHEMRISSVNSKN